MVERFNERNIDAYVPSAPPLEDAVMDWQATRNAAMASTPSAVTLTPSMASQGSTSTLGPHTPNNPVRRNNSNRGMNNRPHQFVQKNNFKTETCGPCQKRIKFGKICYKCRECRAVAHPECRDRAPLPCVPSGSATKTPGRQGGYAR